MRAPPFVPSVHGFPFANEFTVAGGLFGLSSPLAPSFGLAAGMCWAALDRYVSGRRIPRDLTRPDAGDALYLEFVQRQTNALSGLGWDVLRRVQQEPEVGIVRSLAARSRRSWRSIRREIDSGRPALLLALRADGVFGDPSTSAPVLAHSYSIDRRIGRASLSVYDPNRPGSDSVRLTFRLGGPRTPLGATLAAEPVRGFLHVPYDRGVPAWLTWEAAGDVARSGPAPVGAPIAAWDRRGTLHVLDRTEGPELVTVRRDRRGRWTAARLPLAGASPEGEERLDDLAVIEGPRAIGRTAAGDLVELYRSPLGRWRARNVTQRRGIGDGFRVQTAPCLLRAPRGRLDAFACREGHLIHYERRPGGQWRAQNVTARLGLSASHELSGVPVAIRTGEGTQHVLGRSGQGDLIHFRRGRDGRWGARNVTAGLPGAARIRLAGDPAAVAWPDGKELTVFAVDGSGGVAHLRWTPRAGWRARSLLPDAAAAEVAFPSEGPLQPVAGEDGTLHLFARAADGRLMHAWAARSQAWRLNVLTGTRPTTPADLGLEQGPCAVRGTGGELRVFGRLAGDLVLYRWHPGADWVAESFARERWTEAGGGIAGPVVRVEGRAGGIVACDLRGGPILVRATPLGAGRTLLLGTLAAVRAGGGLLLDWAAAPARLASRVADLRRAEPAAEDATGPAASAVIEAPEIREPAPEEGLLPGGWTGESREVRELRRERRRLESEREELSADREALVADREELGSEREQLTSDRESVSAERDRVAGERELLGLEEERLTTDRQQLAAERDDLAAERAQAAAERERLDADRHRMAVEREELAAERDGVRAERDGVTAERDAFAAERNALAAERERLSAEAERLRAEREQVERERVELAGDRDLLAGKREGIAPEAGRGTSDWERPEYDEGAIAELEAERQRLTDELAGARQAREEIDRRLAAAAADADALARERAAVAEERDRLLDEATAAADERDRFDAERRRFEAERDRLEAVRGRLQGDRDEITREEARTDAAREALEAERDGLASQAAALVEEKKALAAEREAEAVRQKAAREALEAEREQLATWRSALEAEMEEAAERRAALEKESGKLAAMAAERTSLGAERPPAGDDQSRLHAARDALEAEREQLATWRRALEGGMEEAAKRRAGLDEERAALEQERAALEESRAAVEAERGAIEDARSTLEEQRRALEEERSQPKAPPATPPAPVALAEESAAGDETAEAAAERIASELEEAAAVGEARRAAREQDNGRSKKQERKKAGRSRRDIAAHANGKPEANGKVDSGPAAAPASGFPARGATPARHRSPALDGLPLFDPDEPITPHEPPEAGAQPGEAAAQAAPAPQQSEVQKRHKESRALKRILALSDRYSPKIFSPGEDPAQEEGDRAG